MAKPVAIPNTFATQTGNIPLSLLDTNFTTLSTALNDPATYSNYAIDSGAANAYIVNLNPIPSSLLSMVGVPFTFKPVNNNTGASTLNLNSFGAISILSTDGVNLTSSSIIANGISSIVYDGTTFRLVGSYLNIGSLNSVPYTSPQITTSVASNALTIALAAGFIGNFRSTTLSNGSTTSVTSNSINLIVPTGATGGAPVAITSASATMAGTTTLTINTGPSAPIQVGAIIFQAGTRIGKVASLGTYVGGVGTGTVILDASATFTAVALVIINPARFLVLALNNAGTIELAITGQAGGLPLDETGLISTTAITSGATANNVIYSTTSRTNLAYKVVGFIDIAQATVGTYALAPEMVFSAISTTLATIFGLGNGQSPKNVASQRVSGQTYINILGRPFFMYSVVTNQTGGSTTIVVNGITVGQSSINTAGTPNQMVALIPSGASYSKTDTTNTSTWIENI